MANPREIVTLQVGHYSNYIGAHWWNLQEGSFVYDAKKLTDINHDVLFREGRTRNGEETYVPRLVSIDLKGSLNTLKEDGILYGTGQKSSQIPWTGNVKVYKTEPSQKNEFLRDLEKEEARIRNEIGSDSEKDICQAHPSNLNTSESEEINSRTKYYDLDHKVQLWSDFVGTHYHPRSIYLIDQYSHNNDVEPFEHFDLGQQVWTNEKVSDAIENKIRYFAEECDSLQGFHLMIDGDNGFTGLGDGISNLLQEEYGTKTVISIPAFPTSSETSNTKKNNIKMFTIAFALQRFSSSTSVVIPTSLARSIRDPSKTRSFPFLNYNPYLPYHTSSIIASALDTITLLYRTRNSPVLLSEFASSFGYRGMTVSGLSLSLPFPVNPDSIQSGCTVNEKNVCQSLTFGFDPKQNLSLFQMMAVRGVSEMNFSNSLPHLLQKNKGTNLNREELLQSIVDQTCPSKFSVIKEVRDACYTHAPFPNIFNSHVETGGFVNMAKKRSNSNGVSQVPVLAGLHCNTSVGATINEVWEFCNKQDLKRLHDLFSHSNEIDDVKEMLENLQQFGANYVM